jgi:hypothetical protein
LFSFHLQTIKKDTATIAEAVNKKEPQEAALKK